MWSEWEAVCSTAHRSEPRSILFQDEEELNQTTTGNLDDIGPLHYVSDDVPVLQWFMNMTGDCVDAFMNPRSSSPLGPLLPSELSLEGETLSGSPPLSQAVGVMKH